MSDAMSDIPSTGTSDAMGNTPSPNTSTSIDMLRNIPLFAGLSDQDLQWLWQCATTRDAAPGEVILEEGAPGDSLYVVLEGELEVTKLAEGRNVVINTVPAGQVVGEMALLSRSVRMATVRASQTSRLLKVGQETFMQLLTSRPSATLAILHTVMQRLRNTESMLRQSDKMAALGTLAAGLAHELNNPAAAVQRSVSQLSSVLAEEERLALDISSLSLTPEQRQRLETLRADNPPHAGQIAKMDALARSDLESDVQDWLEQHGVDDPWDIAPTLVSCGWNVLALDDLDSNFSPQQLPTVVSWLAQTASVQGLLDEAAQSGARISEIVKAVKSYSYLDQAPVQQVNVEEGLENTLIILRHKLKQGVSVARQYEPDLPAIEAFASELNQVWTNIMDNAIDAMGGKGELTLRTQKLADGVAVEICDNGPGIPADALPRVFDAFYTTKAPGEGTGLGLHISYNIIQKHRGRISVRSRPGETCFRIELPALLQRGAS